MKKLTRILFSVAVLLVFVLMAGGQKLFRSFTESKREYQYLTLFSEVASLVQAEYVESIDPAQKFPGAYSAMLSTLHRTAAYLDAGQTHIYNLYNQSNACTTGIYGSKTSDYFRVTDVIEGSPGHIAGVKPGNLIKAVDGKSIFGRSRWEMVMAMATEKPETLELIVLGDSTTKPSRVLVQTRSNAAPPALSTAKPQPGMLLVKLTRIDSQSAATLKTILEKENPGPNPVRLIIDLRTYTGGSLQGFIDMTRLLFQKSSELALKTKENKETFQLGSPDAFDYQAVVIINPSTMMFSELLAAMFKSRKTGITLIGSQTHGFVSRLSHIAMGDGSSVLVPDGLFRIDGANPAVNGVEPDVKVKIENTADIIKRSISILTHESNQKKTQ
jgi:carboxyl-terminal processing protease